MLMFILKWLWRALVVGFPPKPVQPPKPYARKDYHTGRWSKCVLVRPPSKIMGPDTFVGPFRSEVDADEYVDHANGGPSAGEQARMREARVTQRKQ